MTTLRTFSNISVYLYRLTLALIVASILATCSEKPGNESSAYLAAKQVAFNWNRLLLELERHTPGYRPPVSARMFAYVEMTGYEAALPAMLGNRSLESNCPGYVRVMPTQAAFHLPSALNAAYAHVLRAFFPTAPKEYLQAIDRLETRYANRYGAEGEATSIESSIAFGRKSAAAVWAYSMQDSIGHDGFLYNFDQKFVAKNCKGCWTPAGTRHMPPLLPGWGKARPFLVPVSEVQVKPPLPFDENRPSAFFSAAMEVFSISQSLSAEERWIAEFWSDDVPGLTCTPVGRWVSIATQALEKSSLSFPEIMETYLKTSIAMCDGAIAGWEAKYHYQLERPETYIRRNIQPDWEPLHHSPPFPSYPSGHSIFGGSASAVLSAALGNEFEMIDFTHDGRKEFASKARSFHSFEEMAQENAYSRMLIGVHFRMDCEEGLRLGKTIGQRVAAVSFQKGQAKLIPEK